MKFLLLIQVIFFIHLSVIFSQTDSSHIIIEEILDDLIEGSPKDVNPDFYDIIEYLIQNPVDLNSGKISNLLEIPIVDFQIAELIIKHRNKYGSFFSTSELFSIKEIPSELVKKIIPFVTVSKSPFSTVNYVDKEEIKSNNIIANSEIYLRSRFKNDLQNRKGFIENKYAGSKASVYNRIIIKYKNNYQFGFLTEKDGGETEFDDFTSAHFFIKDFGLVKNLVIGDYNLEFGQGLAMWNSFGFSKGAEAVYSVKKNERKIIPYTSLSENNFLKGVAGTFQYKAFSVSTFYSKNKFDANIDRVTRSILSTPENGLHRTETEISKRKTAEETIIGGRIDFHKENIVQVGILHYQSKFNYRFRPSSVFDISGDKFNYTSVACNLYVGSINFFGEAVYNGTSIASIGNIQISINSIFQFVSSIRNYPPDYVNIHGFSFGEKSGELQNEFGIYNGLKWRLPFGTLNLYYDQFSFPYASFDNPLPADGDEIFVEFVSRPFSKVQTKLRYKEERKELLFKINNENSIAERTRKNVRGEVIYEISNSLRWKSRFEYNVFSVTDANLYEEGFLFLQDFRFVPSSGINIYSRMVFFRTESFNSAIYEYENDLTGISTNPAMYGEGLRWYFILRYKIFSFIILSLKYSETYKPKERNIGSGDSEIKGNLDNKISFQLDLNF